MMVYKNEKGHTKQTKTKKCDLQWRSQN